MSGVWEQSADLSPPPPRTISIQGKSGRKCMLTGKKANNGWTVSFSHIRNKKLRVSTSSTSACTGLEKQRYVRLRISTSAMKSITKIGLEAMAKRAGLDLESLAYSDASRGAPCEWLVENGASLSGRTSARPRSQAGLHPQVEGSADEEEGHERRAETERFAERWGMTVA